MKQIKKDFKKKKMIYEKASITEKEMFIEAGHILNNNKRLQNIQRIKEENQLKERTLTVEDMPHNKTYDVNMEKYYKEDCSNTPEIETDEIRRLFNFYNPKGDGYIKKKDLNYLFIDIKEILKENNLELKEKLFYNTLLKLGYDNLSNDSINTRN